MQQDDEAARRVEEVGRVDSRTREYRQPKHLLCTLDLNNDNMFCFSIRTNIPLMVVVHKPRMCGEVST